MSDEQLLDAVLKKQQSVFSLSDERIRRLLILLLQKVRQR
jgi:hypothetical protein